MGTGFLAFGGLPLPRLMGGRADLVTRLLVDFVVAGPLRLVTVGKDVSLAGVEANLALCLSPTLKALGVDLGVAVGADFGVVVARALGGRPRLLGVTSEADEVLTRLALFALGGSGGGMVVAMLRLGRPAAAVVSYVLPRGVVTVGGTGESVAGEGANADADCLLPFGGIDAAYC